VEFSEWTPDEPARIIDLRPDGALLRLIRYYEGTRTAVVHEVFGQAYTLGAQTAVIEFRYLDPDYRSEHSRFYSTTFRRYPSVAHRIHFFSEPPPETWRDPVRALDFSELEASYLGFVVLRPLAGARVGRAALAPPSDLGDHLTCATTERVNVFGIPMRVRSAPFMAQDAQLGVCAHMTLWVAAQHHHLAYGRERRTAGDIAELIPTDLGLGRPAPSSGLTVDQLAAGCRALGLPPLVYKCSEKEDLPTGEQIPSIVCRYLNSGMPVIVAAGGHHAFTLVGYRRVDAGTDDERIHFIRQDDESGPYQLVEDFAHDKHGEWDWLIVPLPSKVFVPGEVAESLGKERLLQTAGNSGDPACQPIVAGANAEPRAISFRSTVVRSNRFKASLDKRGFDTKAAALYRRLPLPRWVWVVEAIQREERTAGTPAVVAEAVIDATDHSRDPHVLAWRVPGSLWTWLPDQDKVGDADLDPHDLVDSIARYTSEEPLPAQPT
jgi:hypothetical protein